MAKTLRPEPTAGWPAFFAWALCGAIWTFSVLSFAGPFAAPFAILLTWLLLRYAPDRRDAMGVGAGMGVLLVSLGVLRTQESCIDCNSGLWLVLGAAVMLTAFSLYGRARRRG